MNKTIILILSVFGSLLAGIIGSIFTTPNIDSWYRYLNKPFFNPPSWVFGPVWTILYILIGISLFRVIVKKTKKLKKRSYLFFIIQILLNTIWSILFFGLRNPQLALLEILILWVTILFTIIEFRKIDKLASYLLYPYILWVSFASILNLYIFLLN